MNINLSINLIVDLSSFVSPFLTRRNLTGVECIKSRIRRMVMMIVTLWRLILCWEEDKARHQLGWSSLTGIHATFVLECRFETSERYSFQ